ncbi:MAG TPA: YCF48-related protein [Usitatibacter sp.]|nr:YCF48-related protein [Usitatibacter sp.]
MDIRCRALGASLASIALVLAGPARAAGFVDVLDLPAMTSPLAAKSLLQAVARAGDRLVAVGQRGHIVVSDDAGATWRQSPCPVSSDLTAVFFVDRLHGWAAGHDGVILHSADGGEHWEVQLTGRLANEVLVAAMERRAVEQPHSESARAWLTEARRFREQGADKPFLDVWFADRDNGFAVGAYNLLFRTADGGRTWEPWFDRIDNPKLYNLYAIRPAGGALYIVGEAGLVAKLDVPGARFRALPVPYKGSFFGLAEAGSALVVFGLRGNAYRSADGGATWSKVDAGLPASIVAATRTARGALLLADAAGRVAASRDGAESFFPVALDRTVPVSALVEVAPGRLASVGPRGVALSGFVAP